MLKMSFCTKCGTELKEDAKFCPSCGAPTEQKAEPAAEEKQPEQNTYQQNTYQQNTYQQNTTSDFAQKFDQFTDTEDRTAEFDKADISANKVYAILAYIGFLVLVPLIAVPKSKFARFHANQGLVLLIGEVAYNIVRSVLVYVLRLTMWGPLRIVYNAVKFATGAAGLVFVVFAVIGIVNAAQGIAKELPLVGKVKILK